MLLPDNVQVIAHAHATPAMAVILTEATQAHHTEIRTEVDTLAAILARAIHHTAAMGVVVMEVMLLCFCVFCGLLHATLLGIFSFSIQVRLVRTKLEF
jgi:hypothetical protein